MSEYLDIIHEKTKKLMFICDHISALAEAFYKTGNNTIAYSLNLIVDNIYEASESIKNAVNKEVDDRYKDSLQSTDNMVNACLAVSKLNNGESE